MGLRPLSDVLIRWDGVKVKVLSPLGSGEKIRFVIAPLFPHCDIIVESNCAVLDSLKILHTSF